MSDCTVGNVRHASFEEILAEYGSLVWKTEGTSMEPLMSTGDLVTVERPKGRLKRFDVVLYKQRERYVLHRVLRVDDGFYRIVGDNTLVVEQVPDGAILGVMCGLTHRGREINLAGWRYRLYVRLWGGNLKARIIASRCPKGIRCLLRPLRRVLRPR